jgi:hypothetical protein
MSWEGCTREKLLSDCLCIVKAIFSMPQRPYRLWGPPSLLGGACLKLSTRLQVVPRLMHGVILPLTHTTSWRGIRLSTRKLEPGSSVSIVSWLRTGRPEFDPQQRQRIFPLTSAYRPARSGAHPASYTVGTGGSFPGDKERPGRDTDHSPPSSAEVKKVLELYLLSPKASPWRVAGPHCFYKNNFIIYL